MNFRFSFLLLLLFFQESRASDIVVDFTPYNCFTIGYDTVVQFVPNDRIVIINRAPSPFSAQYFRERNGIVVDTIISSYGDTMWSTIIGTGDTLISIRVWAMPGACYGQQYHLQIATQVIQVEQLDFIRINNRQLIIGNIDRNGYLFVYDLSGERQLSNPIHAAEKTMIDLQNLKAGFVIIVLVYDSKTIRRKFLLT
ncbi:MAG: hypothetical protein ACKOGP_06620 [Bacteroidota bacterium]